MRLVKRSAILLTLLSVLSLPIWAIGCGGDATSDSPAATDSAEPAPDPDLGSSTAEPSAPESGSTTGGGTETP